jgi:pyridoxine 4-dehydrogenase
MSIPRTTTIGEYRVTRIGLGTNRLTDTPENRDFLSRAIGAGLNFIDTAHLYTGGESERAIGDALAPFPADVVVATKGGYHPGGGRPEQLRAELEESFERLRTDTIPLYYLHRVDLGVPPRGVAERPQGVPRFGAHPARRRLRGERGPDRACTGGGPDRGGAE